MQKIEIVAQVLRELAFKLPNSTSLFPPAYYNLMTTCDSFSKDRNTIAITKSNLQKQCLKGCGFENEDHFNRALYVLVNLGKVIEYENIVILNPSWLNSLFTMVITVIPSKKEFVKDGILHHSHLPWEEHIKGTAFTDETVLKMLYHFKLGYPVFDSKTQSVSHSLIPSSNRSQILSMTTRIAKFSKCRSGTLSTSQKDSDGQEKFN
jgi:hypothetical protein